MEKRLKNWVSTLDKKQLKKIVLELTEFAIVSEEVSFYKTSRVPYWSNSGETLDGTESEEED